MKFFPAQFFTILRSRLGHQNLSLLGRFLILLIGLVLVYSVLFHILMLREGQEHTWFTGIYWTLTVMSTLGFGDITFQTDLGRAFSTGVLLSGMVFLLILLPFTFIEFFYEPWMKAQTAARAPRILPPGIRNHVILTRYDEVTSALINRLKQYQYDYAVLIPELTEALELHDQGINVMLGDLDSPEAYQRLRADQAALVVATHKDTVNSHIAFTVREISESVPIITTADYIDSVDLLQLAGSTHVLQLGEMMGQFIARLATGGDALSHIIGQFEDLYFAEASVDGTPLIGKTLRESRVRELTGITVVGVWQRGRFETASGTTCVNEHMVLVIMGTQRQLEAYDELFAIYHISTAPIVIIGAGRVGRAAAAAFGERGQDYRIVDQDERRFQDNGKYVIGNAADLEILKQAGIMEAPGVLITTHDDDINVYLTIYCRKLCPDMQIISRANLERNIESLHRAGADFVMSYASMGAGAIFNLLKGGDVLMITEGLNLFRLKLPLSLAGKRIAETSIHAETGCYITAVYANNTMHVNPTPSMTLPADSEIILIGSVEAETKFLDTYGS